MSFRNTFVTEFIYQASDDFKEANKDVTKVFEDWASVLSSTVNDRGYGHYAGWWKTLSGSLEEANDDLRQVIYRLERSTKVPFRLVILLESNAMLAYEITPRRS